MARRSSAESTRLGKEALTVAKMTSTDDIDSQTLTTAPPVFSFDGDFDACLRMLTDASLTSGSKTFSKATSSQSTKSTLLYKSTEAVIEDAKKKKKLAISRIFKKMEKAEEVDLCFLVDCTGSMGSYIDRVKRNIKNWYERLQGKYKHLELRVAFVGYTDFDQPASTRTKCLDFTEDIDCFRKLVDSIRTPSGVGGDTAEDVFGGLEAVTKLGWRVIGTKVLIHLADAPCHGTQYHEEGISDRYPHGDPEERSLNDLMSKLYRREIHYHFAFIKRRVTEKMIAEFDRVLLERGGREMTIHTFDANEPSLVDEAVYRSISSSISTSLEIMASDDPNKPKIRDFRHLLPVIPEWAQLESHSVKVSRATNTTSSVTPEALELDLPIIPKVIKRAKHPFAKGAFRLAYHAYFPEENKHVVLKEFLIDDEKHSCLKRYLEVSNIQRTAGYYALEFNKEKPPGIGIVLEFASCGVVATPEDIDGKKRFFSYEPYIKGTYTKFNSNTGYVSRNTDPVTDTCQVFSHYTWVKSGKRLVVCDIQGVKRGLKGILTDPAIHDTNVALYGATNLGAIGIRLFFQSHYCNDICSRMGLEKSEHQPK